MNLELKKSVNICAVWILLKQVIKQHSEESYCNFFEAPSMSVAAKSLSLVVSALSHASSTLAGLSVSQGERSPSRGLEVLESSVVMIRSNNSSSSLCGVYESVDVRSDGGEGFCLGDLLLLV